MMMNKNTNMMAMLALAGMASAPAMAQIGFAPRTDIPAAQDPSWVVAGDFTGDGSLDLAVLLESPDRVMLLVGDGQGGFVQGDSTPLGFDSDPQALAAADINGDGLLDLVVTLDEPQVARVLLNDGWGAFTAGDSVPVGDDPEWIAQGDLNNNGTTDFVVVNTDDDSLTIILDFGVSTSVSTLVLGVEVDPNAVVIGDFDGDGSMDLAVTCDEDDTVRIFLGNGAGGFSAGQVIAAADDPEGILAADFDGDGDLDLAWTAGDIVEIARNDAGVFTPVRQISVGSSDPKNVYVGNFAVDGLGNDLLTVNDGGNSISVLENLGSLNFASPVVFATGLEPEFAAVADFDGSGLDDVAVSNDEGNSVSIFINSAGSGPACVADFDGDGVLTVFDFLAFQTAFDAGDARADIDGDGRLTLLDFLAFQNRFAAGCP